MNMLIGRRDSHSPQRDEDSDHVGDLEHSLGRDLFPLLNVPERVAAENARSRLRHAEVCRL
jgi:hypothetical protein